MYFNLFLKKKPWSKSCKIGKILINTIFCFENLTINHPVFIHIFHICISPTLGHRIMITCQQNQWNTQQFHHVEHQEIKFEGFSATFTAVHFQTIHNEAACRLVKSVSPLWAFRPCRGTASLSIQSVNLLETQNSKRIDVSQNYIMDQLVGSLSSCLWLALHRGNIVPRWLVQFCLSIGL